MELKSFVEENLVVLTAIAGAVIAFLSWVPLRKTAPLKKPVGPATFSFNDSWASTLTAVGAILGTTLSTGDVFSTDFDKATFAGLNLLFGTLIVVAPFFYTAVSKGTVIDDGSTTGAKKTVYQGYVVAFLVSAAITLWAVLGELVTLHFLLKEVVTGVPPSVTAIIAAVMGTTALLVIVHAPRSIGDTLKLQAQPIAAEMEKYGQPAWRLM